MTLSEPVVIRVLNVRSGVDPLRVWNAVRQGVRHTRRNGANGMGDLGLYRLLAPYFLAGFTFPEEADRYLSELGVAELSAVYDTPASVFSGVLTWGDAPKEQRPASGRGRFVWEDITVRFRLVVPRDGAGFINTAAHAMPSPSEIPVNVFNIVPS